jgi:pimeloyl-ACP methyl ester carboxylesterase
LKRHHLEKKVRVHAPADPRLKWKVSGDAARLDGAVLLLHGGKSESYDPVTRTNLTAARMWPFAAPILRRSGRASIAVGLLRDRYQGWNGTQAEPVRDALWALDETVKTFGSAPVVLVGHSMGGRAALRAAGHPTVRGVVALCPWLPESEPFAQLAGRSVLIAHAAQDKVTDPAASLRYAQRATLVADGVRYRRVAHSGHAMVCGAGRWHRMVADFVAEQLGAHALR